MASFNIEIAAKTIPLFAGSYEELESFIVTTELVGKTLSDTAKQDFLQYLYHAKLTSSVRTAIGSYIKPESLNCLIELLRQRYRDNKTIPELQAKLNNIYQGKLSVNVYRERINSIIDNLNRLGIEELGNTATESERNIIVKLNNKLALDTFKRGINGNLKAAIFAARPKTLQEAVELALELENENKLTTDNRILQIQRRQLNTNQIIRQQRFNTNRNNNFPHRLNNRHNNVVNGNNNNCNHTRSYNNSNQNNHQQGNNRQYSYNNFRQNNHQQRNNTSTSYNNFNQNNNQQRNNRPSNYSRNSRNNIYTIQGNEIGSECIRIPEGQN